MTKHILTGISNLPILHSLLPAVDFFRPTSEPENSILHSFSVASLILDCCLLNPVEKVIINLSVNITQLYEHLHLARTFQFLTL